MKTREEIHNEMVEKTDYNIRYARIQIDLLLDIRELLTPILVRRPDIPDKVSEDLRNGVPDNCKEVCDDLIKRIMRGYRITEKKRTMIRDYLWECNQIDERHVSPSFYGMTDHILFILGLTVEDGKK
jgi:hypothetical protein